MTADVNVRIACFSLTPSTGLRSGDRQARAQSFAHRWSRTCAKPRFSI